MFKKRRSINLPVEKQRAIYYTCITYRKQPEWVQQKVKRLCDEIGGQYSPELWLVLTTQQNVKMIAAEHYMSDMTLYTLRKKFYESW